MADEYEYDDGYDDDDGFLYVEDEYGFVDELAETQIPDPGYSGTNYELERETMSWDWDDYPFWDELEYVDDAYWELEGPRQGQQQQGAGVVGQKRKRAAGVMVKAGDKWRKVSALKGVAGRGETGDVVDSVVYKTHSERVVFPPPALAAGRGKVYALLPDWKARFADQDGLVKAAGMPADMRKAAEAKEEDTPSKQAPHMEILDEGEEVDEGGEQDALEKEGGMDGPAVPDPELLKAILKQRLGEAGLDGVDEGAFMASIGKLLAGETTNGDSVTDLTDLLLDKAVGDNAMAGFLSRQGVSLGTGETGEDEEEGEEEDSAISGLDTSPAGAGKPMQMPLHSASSNGPARGRASRSLGKKVTFDVRSSDAEVVGHQQERLPTPPSSQDLAAENAKTTSLRTRAKKAKGPATNSVAAKRNIATAEENSGPGAQLERELVIEADSADAGDAVPVSTPASLQSRKRKAPPVTHDADADAVAGMEEVRAKKEPATRRTRSARAG
ncbi:hypothetical protein LTR12_008772 [Friedmanniomyces endolithicus]|nr:hypothetical protein LTR74_006534 [Friedmanniomyces endolithicus]KAK1816830.1 hypothetical protein LTR12_008772 [Friedmanniomyces endolithicus]